MLYNKKQIIESLVEPTDTNVYWAQIIPNSSEPPILKTFYNGMWVPITNSNNGTNYLVVYGTGTPEENAQEFINAYNLAKTMPRYLAGIDRASDDTVTVYKGQTFDDGSYALNSFKIATNTVINGPANTVEGIEVSKKYAQSLRTTILIAPGYYNFTGEFVHYCPGINIKSLSGNSDVYISAIEPNGNYVFGIETNFTEISGLVTNHVTYQDGVAAIRVAPNLIFDLVVKKCISGSYSFWDNNIAINSVYYGTFIDCEGGGFSFVCGNGPQTLSGKFIRCKADNFSFGFNAIIANATFEDCEGNDYCFGSTDGEYTSTVQNTTVFKNCWAFDDSFGFNASFNYGKYYYCINKGDNSGLFNTNANNLYCSKNGELP